MKVVKCSEIAMVKFLLLGNMAQKYLMFRTWGKVRKLLFDLKRRNMFKSSVFI